MTTQHTPKHRVRTVERDPGNGWIARHPITGAEIWPNFRWTSRSVARSVVRETLATIQKATHKEHHEH